MKIIKGLNKLFNYCKEVKIKMLKDKPKSRKEKVEKPVETKIDEAPFESAVQQEEAEKQEKEITQQPVPIKLKATIIGAELNPETKMWKFTFLSNAPMGEIGQEFDI